MADDKLEKLIDALRTEANISQPDEIRLLNAAADKIADQQAEIKQLKIEEMRNTDLLAERNKQIADLQTRIDDCRKIVDSFPVFPKKISRLLSSKPSSNC